MNTFYQLIDRDTSTITVWWKALHIVSFIIVIISGFITAHTLGRSIDAFGNNCILFANITFSEHGENTTKKPVSLYGLREIPAHLIPINIATSDWGSLESCYFCQFTPLMCMISAVIWGSFFIMCAKGGAGYIADRVYRSWRIVYPALIFAAIATVLMLISTLKLNEGIEAFCVQFEKVFHTTRCTTNIDDYTLSFSPTKRRFVVLLKMAVYCSYICFAGWVMQLTVLILRIVSIVDFQMIKITITPVGNEVVQKIINSDAGSHDTLPSTGTICENKCADKNKRGHRLPFTKKSFPHFGHKKKTVTSTGSKQGTAATIAVAPKPSVPPEAHDIHRVSFIGESPTTQDTDTVKTTKQTLPPQKEEERKEQTLNNGTSTSNSVPSGTVSKSQSTSSKVSSVPQQTQIIENILKLRKNSFAL